MLKSEIIKKANESIKKIPLRDKEYAPVHERVKAFKTFYPEGSIVTEIINMTEDTVTMKASVLDSDGSVIATGHAQEKKGVGMVNGTSHIENCETSAVGRALGYCGIGIDAGIASLNEVVESIENERAEIEKVREDPKTKITKKQVSSIMQQCSIDGVSIKEVCDLEGVKGLADLDYPAYWALTKSWSRVVSQIKEKRGNVQS